jgi:Phosphoesterase family
MCNGGASMCTNPVKACPTGTKCNNLPVSTPMYPQETYVSTTDDQSVVAPYFDIASKYGFANYFFQTNQGPSMPAHQFLFSGTSAPNGVLNQQYFNYFDAENPPGGTGPAGCTAAPSQTVNLVGPSGMENGDAVYSCFHHNSLPTLLDPASVSWKYYANSTDADQSGPQGIWTAPNAIYDICMPLDGTHSVCTGSDWVNDVVFTPSQILHDLGASSPTECGLRQVSWVIPNGDRSDHPGLSGNQNDSHEIEGGPAWVADIINAVGTSPCQNPDTSSYWNTTAIFVVWDDFGGFWDHINPDASSGGPGVLYNATGHPCSGFGCGYIYGFRVPLLVVSPYTPAGYVSGACQSPGNCQNEKPPYLHDFGSIVAFIENNFLGSGAIGQINAQNRYPFADNFAPDYTPPPSLHVPLADFFPLTTARLFQQIILPPAWQSYDANYFLNYNGQILDPDNDAIDND